MRRETFKFLGFGAPRIRGLTVCISHSCVVSMLCAPWFVSHLNPMSLSLEFADQHLFSLLCFVLAMSCYMGGITIFVKILSCKMNSFWLKIKRLCWEEPLIPLIPNEVISCIWVTKFCVINHADPHFLLTVMKFNCLPTQSTCIIRCSYNEPVGLIGRGYGHPMWVLSNEYH